MRADLRRVALGVLALAALTTASAGRAHAHALSPALLVLEERAAGAIDVTWKVPTLRLLGAELRPVLPPDCVAGEPAAVSDDDESVTTRWRVQCTAGLLGRRIAVEGLGGAKTDALVRLELADGRAIDSVLRARDPALIVPAREGGLGLARRYVGLGVEHILTGWDHLLFVFGLLLLVGGTRQLVATITAFTLGHSVTLTLAVLDLARVPSGPVEVLIAASIFVLAVELARGHSDATARSRHAAATASGRPAATAMRRRPWLMALLFGLLHGLGFAGTLREAGLPAAAIPTALFGFNLGIEVGQLAFVLTVLALAALGRPIAGRLPTWARAVPVYAMGTLAASWMIERALPLVF